MLNRQTLVSNGPAGGLADQLDRITLALADLDAASKPSDVDLPGWYRLHPLRGDLDGRP